MLNEGFSRSERILKKIEYQQVFEGGKKIRNDSFTLHLLPNVDGRKRLGIIATRKFGNAVERNRAKRVFREIFRRNKKSILMGDIVVVVHSSFLDKSYKEIERTFQSSLRHFNIFNIRKNTVT